jgi:NCS1 family nucleobase:cation symporter-1
VTLAGKFESKMMITFAMIGIIISTLATNIAANIVSPANDFSNLAPGKINFRTGGYITGIIGIVIFPWKLVADPAGYIYTWLVGYSALLGPIGGIMIADYYFVRKQKLDVNDLYKNNGAYSYRNGFNPIAVIALLAGILPNIPGFLAEIRIINGSAIPAWISELYHYAWFVGFFISGVLYVSLMRSYKVPVIKDSTYVAID